MFGRAFSGESMFVNRYTARNGNGLIAFASSFPGSIRAFEIAPGQEIIAQKSAFLASSASVEMSIFFQKRFGSGLFGGDTQGQGTDLTIGSGFLITSRYNIVSASDHIRKIRIISCMIDHNIYHNTKPRKPAARSRQMVSGCEIPLSETSSGRLWPQNTTVYRFILPHL